MSPRKIPEPVLSKALTTHDAIERLICGIDEVERDFHPGKYSNLVIMGIVLTSKSPSTSYTLGGR